MFKFQYDTAIGSGFYSDKYFVRTKQILDKDNYDVNVCMQIFQKGKDACLCGIDEVKHVLKMSLGENIYGKLAITHRNDGDIVQPWEPVMHIWGNYRDFAHLETVYLGILARGTRVATNVYHCCKRR